MRLPRFVPILTSYLERVAGRDMDQLLASPAALARALAEMQVVVGHDGVLCVYDPALLARACLGKPREQIQTGDAIGGELNPPDEVPGTTPVSTLLETIQPLRHRLPENAVLYAALAGPGLLHSQLQSAVDPESPGGGIDPGYVIAVLRAVVRAALERHADGVALIERITPATPPRLLRAHKSVRKLADFYNAGFLEFALPESTECPAPDPAHCVFELAAAAGPVDPVVGHTDVSIGVDCPPWTTAGDVAADVPIEALKQLAQEAQRR